MTDPGTRKSGNGIVDLNIDFSAELADGAGLILATRQAAARNASPEETERILQHFKDRAAARWRSGLEPDDDESR